MKSHNFKKQPLSSFYNCS